MRVEVRTRPQPAPERLDHRPSAAGRPAARAMRDPAAALRAYPVMDAFAALRSSHRAARPVSGYRVLQQQPAPARRAVRTSRRETARQDVGIVENAGTLLIGVVAAVMVWAFIDGPLDAPHRTNLAGGPGASVSEPSLQQGMRPGMQSGMQPGTLAAAVLDDTGASAPAERPAPPAASSRSPAGDVFKPAREGFLPRAKALADTPPVRLAMAPLPDELAAVPPPDVSAITLDDITQQTGASNTAKITQKTAPRRAKSVRSLYRAPAKPDPQMTKYGRRFPRWARQMYETPWSPLQSNTASSGR